MKNYHKIRNDNIRANNPILLWATRAIADMKKRSKRNNIICEITRNDLMQIAPKICQIFNVELLYDNQQTTKDNSPSVDRLDNSKGYTIDNINVISHKANRIKSNATIEDLIKVRDWLYLQSK